MATDTAKDLATAWERASFREFWQERQVCTLTTVRPDGTPHVVPVGATLDPDRGIARVITSSTSHKARLVAAANDHDHDHDHDHDGLAMVAICQVDGRRWSTLEGRARIRTSPEEIAEAEYRYTRRYRQPRPNPARIVIEIAVSRVLGNV